MPFIFVGTMESISNAKILLDYNLDHLRVGMQLTDCDVWIFTMVWHTTSELQIRRSNKYNLEIIFHISPNKHIL